jgi:hypothetical protein
MLRELWGRLSSPLVNASLMAYRRTYARQGAGLTQPYSGVIASLQALSSFTLGIVTTKEPEQAEIVVRRLGLSPFFQHIQLEDFKFYIESMPEYEVFKHLRSKRQAWVAELEAGHNPFD